MDRSGWADRLEEYLEHTKSQAEEKRTEKSAMLTEALGEWDGFSDKVVECGLSGMLEQKINAEKQRIAELERELETMGVSEATLESRPSKSLPITPLKWEMDRMIQLEQEEIKTRQKSTLHTISQLACHSLPEKIKGLVVPAPTEPIDSLPYVDLSKLFLESSLAVTTDTFWTISRLLICVSDALSFPLAHLPRLGVSHAVVYDTKSEADIVLDASKLNHETIELATLLLDIHARTILRDITHAEPESLKPPSSRGIFIQKLFRFTP